MSKRRAKKQTGRADDCLVRWCVALAADKSGLCAVHKRAERIHPDVLAADETFPFVLALNGVEDHANCGSCRGRGKCEDCNGFGTHDCSVSTCSHTHECEACDGEGVCAACAGSGYASSVFHRGRAKVPTMASDALHDTDERHAAELYLRSAMWPVWVPPSDALRGGEQGA